MRKSLNRGTIVRGDRAAAYRMPSFEKVRSSPSDERSPIQHAEEIEREAYEKGFEEGEKAGFAMGEQKIRVILEKLEKVVKELALFRDTLVSDLEPQVVQVAVAIAQRILLREVSLSPETVVEITKEALTRLERTGQITIKIHPSLFDLFTKHRPSLLAIHPDIVFDVDPSVSAHGTVVVGTSEEVVTAIDEQLNNLAKEMVA